jgi:hypothetical protein
VVVRSKKGKQLSLKALLNERQSAAAGKTKPAARESDGWKLA